ncbi:permease [uncultured Desulfovibrio sp.]|uniref:permease n=1 Tax=uncultured Desulfovibrio sp. TaxID=167968 RepID=UPI00261F69A9|nr:permease [uncultured Desulfovibrio sp.]
MQGSRCCQSGKDKPQSAPQGNAGPLRELTPLRPQPVDRLRYFGTGALVFAIWTGCYLVIEPLARLLTQAVPGLSDRAAAALEFFLYDTAKILLLLLLMVYVIGWLRAGLHVERVRDFLAGRRRVLGYVLGAGFGAITPFCSCSSIPLFLGFTTSGIPVGITLAFLITSPLINEIAVVLLWGLLGWKLTLVYVLAGLGAGIIGGWFMDVLRAERWLQDYLKESIASGAAQRPAGAEQRKMGLRERHLFASGETRSIFRRVWRWVIIGVGLGALLHGYVPEAWFAEHLGAGQWWSVPAAVAVGIPLYTNVTGIVPVMESLLLKGLPVGTTLAFCMSAVAASLPEVLMLRQVMRGKLLALFLGTLLVLFSLLGWLLNAVQGWLL